MIVYYTGATVADFKGFVCECRTDWHQDAQTPAHRRTLGHTRLISAGCVEEHTTQNTRRSAQPGPKGRLLTIKSPKRKEGPLKSPSKSSQTVSPCPIFSKKKQRSDLSFHRCRNPESSPGERRVGEVTSSAGGHQTFRCHQGKGFVVEMTHPSGMTEPISHSYLPPDSSRIWCNAVFISFAHPWTLEKVVSFKPWMKSPFSEFL